MKLVAGLGNPGPQYRETRHNVGFLVIDELARRWGVEQWREQFDAMAAKTVIDGEAVMLAKPMTFMNLSGYSVAEIARYYRIEPSDVFIVSDDAALPLARLRVRREGSDGGHNGLKSVIASLGTTAFPRLRVGVGRGEGDRELADHVLGRFVVDEREQVSVAVLRAADATEMFLREGIERVMNAFNAAEKQDPEPAA